MIAALLGPSGFVGTAVGRALTDAGFDVRSLPAPRLSVQFDTDPRIAAEAWAEGCPQEFAELVASLSGAAVVVNAAGLAAPTAGATPELWGANAVLPRVIALACREAGAPRFVHISSAAVLGSVRVLDEAPFTSARTPYASSKGAGEAALRDIPNAVVYRPTSVLGVDRPIAHRLAGVLRAKWLLVPSDDPNLPVALVGNVGRAVALLARTAEPPPITLHPWEGMTVASLATAFGREQPLRRLPRIISGPARATLRLGVRRGGPLGGKLRRLEMLWDGQDQRSSMPELGLDVTDQAGGYRLLGQELERRRDTPGAS